MPEDPGGRCWNLRWGGLAQCLVAQLTWQEWLEPREQSGGLGGTKDGPQHPGRKGTLKAGQGWVGESSPAHRVAGGERDAGRDGTGLDG